MILHCMILNIWAFLVSLLLTLRAPCWEPKRSCFWTPWDTLCTKGRIWNEAEHPKKYVFVFPLALGCQNYFCAAFGHAGIIFQVWVSGGGERLAVAGGRRWRFLGEILGRDLVGESLGRDAGGRLWREISGERFSGERFWPAPELTYFYTCSW